MPRGGNVSGGDAERVFALWLARASTMATDEATAAAAFIPPPDRGEESPQVAVHGRATQAAGDAGGCRVVALVRSARSANVGRSHERHRFVMSGSSPGNPAVILSRRV